MLFLAHKCTLIYLRVCIFLYVYPVNHRFSLTNLQKRQALCLQVITSQKKQTFRVELNYKCKIGWGVSPKNDISLQSVINTTYSSKSVSIKSHTICILLIGSLHPKYNSYHTLMDVLFCSCDLK